MIHWKRTRRGSATMLGSAALVAALAMCAPSAPPAAVDVAAYTADQMACVEREPTDACRADRAACKARMDACRDDVKRRYGR